jgi:hypothetical protein
MKPCAIIEGETGQGLTRRDQSVGGGPAIRFAVIMRAAASFQKTQAAQYAWLVA